MPKSLKISNAGWSPKAEVLNETPAGEVRGLEVARRRSGFGQGGYV